MQRARGRELTPLRTRRDEPGAQLSIHLTHAERAQLGPNPSARAAELVRAGLRRRPKK